MKYKQWKILEDIFSFHQKRNYRIISEEELERYGPEILGFFSFEIRSADRFNKHILRIRDAIAQEVENIKKATSRTIRFSTEDFLALEKELLDSLNEKHYMERVINFIDRLHLTAKLYRKLTDGKLNVLN